MTDSVRPTADHIPKMTGALGRWLCSLGKHRWKETGSSKTVMPLGSAVMMKKVVRNFYCARRGCEAKRQEEWNREQSV